MLAGQRPKRRVVRATKVTWVAPDAKLIKVNTDEAFSPASNIAGGGGIIRNPEAAQHGDNIWMETDATAIVQMLGENEHGSAPARHILPRIRQKHSGLNVKISFIPREGNKPADYLAEQGKEEQELRIINPRAASDRLRAMVEMDGKGIPNFRFQRRWSAI
ncbi:hypothetical protein SASPL_108672 [Salvia splendens]|uniref:RNase H type-1 domain-containing protein n=1 Tax=Salvia splendens TaxID=180675 RepID=A0A8X9A6E9_SALSN|nr:hypothetical protein SASPL_108672 [Salvia splendens]